MSFDITKPKDIIIYSWLIEINAGLGWTIRIQGWIGQRFEIQKNFGMMQANSTNKQE